MYDDNDEDEEADDAEDDGDGDDGEVDGEEAEASWLGSGNGSAAAGSGASAVAYRRSSAVSRTNSAGSVDSKGSEAVVADFGRHSHSKAIDSTVSGFLKQREDHLHVDRTGQLKERDRDREKDRGFQQRADASSSSSTSASASSAADVYRAPITVVGGGKKLVIDRDRDRDRDRDKRADLSLVAAAAKPPGGQGGSRPSPRNNTKHLRFGFNSSGPTAKAGDDVDGDGAGDADDAGDDGGDNDGDDYGAYVPTGSSYTNEEKKPSGHATLSKGNDQAQTLSQRRHRTSDAISVRTADKYTASNSSGGARDAGKSGQAETASDRLSEAELPPAPSNEFDYLKTEEITPSAAPQQDLAKAVAALEHQDWPEIFHTLNTVRRLALHHGPLLVGSGSLHITVLRVLKQVDNLRSAVAKNALLTIGDIFEGLGTAVDAEVAGAALSIIKVK
jgi:hypothetical protein